MRSPRQKRNISVVLLAVGVSYLVLAFTALNVTPANELLFGTVLLAFFGSIFALTGVIAFRVTLARHARLLRGHRLLATWTVSPQEWQQFLANQPHFAGERKNTITVNPERSLHGVKVVVTEESVMVDDDFYHLTELRGLQWHETPPPCLDFRMVTTGKNGSVTWHIRFPAAAGTEIAVRAVWDYFQQRLAPTEPRRLIPRYRVARTACVVMACVSALLLVFARATYGVAAMRTPMLVAMVTGLLGLPLGVVVGAITHWWLVRGPGREQQG